MMYYHFQGLELSSKESEARELNAKLHQTELNNTLQQDLLKHMMVDRVDIEVDNLMTNQVDGKRNFNVCSIMLFAISFTQNYPMSHLMRL